MWQSGHIVQQNPSRAQSHVTQLDFPLPASHSRESRVSPHFAFSSQIQSVTLQDQHTTYNNLSVDIMDDMFVPPSVIASQVFSGESYTYHSPLPEMLQNDMTIPCCLGVDEAGRGPVLGQSSLFLKCTSASTEFSPSNRPNGLRLLLPPPDPPPVPTIRHPRLRRLQSPDPHLPLPPYATDLHSIHRPPPVIRLVHHLPLRAQHLLRNASSRRQNLQSQRPSR